MTDQLFLSIWLERHARAERLKHFRTLLRLFPFSQREQPQTTITIGAIDSTEPPLLERSVNGPIDIEDVETTFADYNGADLAYEVEGWWDLWQLDGDWELRPARVILSCFGPEFDNGTERKAIEQEDLRVDFGVDTHYLPLPDVQGSPRMVESNVKSLLHLVHQVENSVPVALRRLETESGENFAERLQQLLMASSRIQ